VSTLKDKASNVKNDFEAEEDENKVQQVYILLENYGSQGLTSLVQWKAFQQIMML
jgi:hypothetical protein